MLHPDILIWSLSSDSMLATVIPLSLLSATALASSSIPPAPFFAPLVAQSPRIGGAVYDTKYLMNIGVGGQGFIAILDLGSSDVWVPSKGFQCLNHTSGAAIPRTACAFGSTGFNASASSTFKAGPPHTEFATSFPNSDYVSGSAAFDTVIFGGLSIPQQEFGLVSSAAWTGDGVSAGILGFGFPGGTSVFNTTTSTWTRLTYNPPLFSAIAQKKLPHPSFSIALNRPSSNSSGYIAFGGIPPVPVTNTSVQVPLYGYSEASGPTPIHGAKATYTGYMIIVQRFDFTHTPVTDNESFTYVIQNGAAASTFPSNVASAYNALYGNNASRGDDGLYLVQCTAQPPAFALVLGGTSFALDPKDLIVKIGTDGFGRDVCISAIQDGGSGEIRGSTFTLGDALLRSVLATFDVANYELTLTQRQPY